MNRERENPGSHTRGIRRANRFLLLILFFVVLIGSASVVFFLLCAPGMPNVLLITIDTLRSDHLGCYGYFRDTSPYLDTVAKEGILFSQSLTVMSHTLPAHVSLLTGKYPRSHKVLVNGANLALGHETLAQILKKEDYKTAAVVGSEMVAGKTGLGRGFDYFDDRFGKPVMVPMQHGNKMIRRYERVGEEVNRLFLQWLDKNERNPFFAWLHYWDPHFPYAAPEPYGTRFQNTRELQVHLAPQIDTQLAFDEEGGLEKINGYDGEVAYVDFCIKGLMEELKKRGLYDNALILITGDHGEGLGEHNWWSHGLYLFEEQVQVPFILRLPQGERGGAKVESQVIGVDAMPTILDALGIPVPSSIDGTSLLSLARNGGSAPGRKIFLERRYYGKRPPKGGGPNWAPGKLFCLRTSAWKYLYGTAQEEELYHLPSDPAEMNNRASAEPEIVAPMREMIRSWVAKHGPDSPGKLKYDEETRKALQALGYEIPDEDEEEK